MHVYIYDDYVSQKKYEQQLIRVETRITDLGLSGKIIRLGMLKNIRAAIQDELRRGVKTIVAVGNNKIYNTVINAMLSIEPTQLAHQQTPLAMIPIGRKNNTIARALGLDDESSACDVLSARRVETLDLVLANDYYFISQAVIDTKGTVMEIDRSYSIEVVESGEVRVINLPLADFVLPEGINPSPVDNELELVIKSSAAKNYLRLPTGNQKRSVFPFKHLNIANPNHALLIDETVEIKCPVDIKLAEKKLPVIVGKNRAF